MSGFDDLGRVLREDAERNAPPASAFDVDALTRAARARRAPRLWGAGALAAAAVLGLGGLALTLPGLSAPLLLAGGASSAEDSMTLESLESDGGATADDRDLSVEESAAVLLGCGDMTLGGERSSARLGVTLSLEDANLDELSAVVTGSLIFENSSATAQRLDGYGTPHLALVNTDNVVIATTQARGSVGLNIVVPAGETVTVPFTSTVTACDDAPWTSDADLSAVAVVELSSGALTSAPQPLEGE